MTWRPPHEFEDLLNGLADELLSEEEEARLAAILRGDALARHRYRKFMALHAGLMWDYAAVAGPAPVETASREVSQARHWRNLWAAAAALVLLAGLAIFFTGGHRPSPEIVTLNHLSGAVSWSGEAGQLRSGLSDGARLRSGTLTIEGDGATAQLQFHDGTLITLSGEAELTFADDGHKSLVVKRGTLSAEVQPQPKGHPLNIRTATAEVEVVGTAFYLSARLEDTLLRVNEGAVKMKRLSDGRVIDVPARTTALASLNSDGPFAAVLTPEPLHEWRFDFATTIPPSLWCGAWQPSPEGGRMVASPYVAGRRPDGLANTHFGVSIRPAYLNPPLALVAQPGSVVRYRLRQDRPYPLQVMLLTHDLRGGFAGNFEYKVPAKRLRPDADGWCDLEIPVADFVRVDKNSTPRPIGATPVGSVLNSVLISSFQKDTKLTISRFELHSPP